DYVPMLWSSSGLANFGAIKGKVRIFIPPDTEVNPAAIPNVHLRSSSENSEFDIGSWADLGAIDTKTPVLVEGGGGDQNSVRLQDVNGQGVQLAVSTVKVPALPPDDDSDVTGSIGSGPPSALPEIFSNVHGDFYLDGIQKVLLPDFANNVSVTTK